MNNKIITGKVVLNHPHLFEKWSYNGTSAPKYSTVIIISKEDKETIDKINNAIDSIIKRSSMILGENIDNIDIKLPIKDGDSGLVSDILYKNSYYMTASSEYPPGVINQEKKPIYNSTISSGIFARVSLTFHMYKFNGMVGIACRLQNVQLFNEYFDINQFSTNPVEDFD